MLCDENGWQLSLQPCDVLCFRCCAKNSKRHSTRHVSGVGQIFGEQTWSFFAGGAAEKFGTARRLPLLFALPVANTLHVIAVLVHFSLILRRTRFVASEFSPLSTSFAFAWLLPQLHNALVLGGALVRLLSPREVHELLL